jgi:hypothetical protein
MVYSFLKSFTHKLDSWLTALTGTARSTSLSSLAIGTTAQLNASVSCRLWSPEGLRLQPGSVDDIWRGYSHHCHFLGTHTISQIGLTIQLKRKNLPFIPLQIATLKSAAF